MGKSFQLGDITPANVLQLRTIANSTLPVTYSDKFYRELLDKVDNKFLRYAYWDGFTVGAFCARVEDHPEIEGKKRLYIMILSVLSPYRMHGIGASLLKEAIELARAEENIVDLYLHAHILNTGVHAFYEKQGFVIEKRVDDYYRNIEEPHAFIFSYKL